MARPRTAVLSAGLEHGLEYAYPFFEWLNERARQTGFNSTLTDGTPEENTRQITLLDSAIFYGCGHGHCCIFTVECTQVMFEVPYECPPFNQYSYKCFEEVGAALARGRHIHLLSCITGYHLGRELVYTYGAKSFIGYNHFFIYGVDLGEAPNPGEPPSDTADYYSSFHSDLAGEESIILNASTVKEAVEAMRNRFKLYIERYTTGDWKDRPIAYWATLMLEHDLNHLVAYGNLNWKPYSTATPPTRTEMLASFLAPFSLAFGIIGTVITPTPQKAK